MAVAAAAEPRSLAATALLTLLALLAFAANSVLCRLALADRLIDAASFTAIRLGSGAVVLVALLALRRSGSMRPGGDWAGAVFLFAYALAFSFAYLSLATGTGALLLFGAVQTSMLVVALHRGERPRMGEWTGLLLAIAGLVYLVLPGLRAPDPAGAAAMLLAGVAWGLYSLHGRGSRRPLADTAGNFLRAAPLAVPALLLWQAPLQLEPAGVLYAAASGALASGLGYAVWYAALPGLSATRAATVQLAVPPLAAVGGLLVLDEQPGLRLLLASVLVLGGIGLAIAARRRG